MWLQGAALAVKGQHWQSRDSTLAWAQGAALAVKGKHPAWIQGTAQPVKEQHPYEGYRTLTLHNYFKARLWLCKTYSERASDFIRVRQSPFMKIMKILPGSGSVWVKGTAGHENEEFQVWYSTIRVSVIQGGPAANPCTQPDGTGRERREISSWQPNTNYRIWRKWLLSRF